MNELYFFLDCKSSKSIEDPLLYIWKRVFFYSLLRLSKQLFFLQLCIVEETLMIFDWLEVLSKLSNSCVRWKWPDKDYEKKINIIYVFILQFLNESFTQIIYTKIHFEAIFCSCPFTNIANAYAKKGIKVSVLFILL